MQVDLESVDDRVVVDLRGQPAGAHQRFAVEAGLLGDRAQFVGRVARMPAAAAADVDAELVRPRIEAAFQAPSTDVVMPDECQSIPITLPSAWNQNGSLSLLSSAEEP